MYAGPDTLEKDRGFQSGSDAVRVWSIVSRARPLIGDGWSRTGDLLGVTGVTVISSVKVSERASSLASAPPESLTLSLHDALPISFPVAEPEPALSVVTVI